MKLSKSVLQAVVLGLAVGATTSGCSELKKPTEGLHLNTCPKNCQVDHTKVPDDGQTWDNCPACGLG